MLSVFFIAELNQDSKLIASDDVASIEELKIDDIKSESVGGLDVKIALEELKKVIPEYE